jgi:hypothetical protein
MSGQTLVVPTTSVATSKLNLKDMNEARYALSLDKAFCLHARLLRGFVP